MNKDFIPEGEDAGGLGSGFRDFVPAKEPIAPVQLDEEAGAIMINADEGKVLSFNDMKKVYTDATGKSVPVGTSKVALAEMLVEIGEPVNEDTPKEGEIK